MYPVYLPSALESIKSRGSMAAKPGSLGALHQQRVITLAQYWTPDWLSRYIWALVSPAFSEEGRYSVLDNSIGSARLFKYADPKKVNIFGFDVDNELIGNVVKELDQSEHAYKFDIVTASMDNVELDRFSAAFINPPFSIPLSSPFMRPYTGITHYGRLGPNTSALSHEYALAQALAHCDIVAAIVPHTTKDVFLKDPVMQSRLRAVFSLPTYAFKDENVSSVNTELLVFGLPLKGVKAAVPESIRVKTGTIDENSVPPTLFQFFCKSVLELGGNVRHPIQVNGLEVSNPVIVTPVSSDKRVILKRSGRRIKLHFFDGATEARVLNALMVSRVQSTRFHKYPKSTRYSGQFRLSLDALSMQDDPATALTSVCDIIRKAGGQVEVSQQLEAGLKAILLENRKMSVPFGRSVYRRGSKTFTAKSKRMGLINKSQFGAVIAKNEQVCVSRLDDGFSIQTSRGEFCCQQEAFFNLFEPDSDAGQQGFWEEIYPPIAHTFPTEIEKLKTKALSLGLNNVLTWDFQLEDLLELAFRPKGGIAAWQMALGKSRLAIALSLLLNGTSLIVLKSRLVLEMVDELKKLGITDFQVIKTIDDISRLKKVNIISYERLRRPLHNRFPKLTLAKLLRKKVRNVLCDEGGLLANFQSQQTRSLWQLGAKRNYVLDGTVMPNYPREMLPIVSLTAGQERAYQPFSMFDGFMEKRLFISAIEQPTGREEFNRRYVTIDWSTNELNETGVGAKREIPKIKPAYLGDYRQWLAPLVKRRLQQEPAVSRYVSFPVPEINEPIEVEWELAHLQLYIRTLEEFATWFRAYAKTQSDDGKALNLTLILARIEACFKVANTPSQVSGFATGFSHLTTKEIACISLVKTRIDLGQRPIVFARNPLVLHRLSAELTRQNITNLVFTGEETIAKRINKLDTRIRQGNDQVLLASLGVTQDGLNIPQVNAAIFYNRSFKPREEQQGLYRMIRPQQTAKRITCDFLHLGGSIDSYMAQLNLWKSKVSDAALDYGEQPEDDEDFIDFNAFIYRFIESLPALKTQLESLRKLAA